MVIHVPYRLRKAFRKIHVRLVRELEKKFSGKVSADFLYFHTFGYSVVEKSHLIELQSFYCIGFDIINNGLLKLPMLIILLSFQNLEITTYRIIAGDPG